MLNINRAFISKVTVHRVGHKVRQEKNIPANHLMPLTEELEEHLRPYFLTPFKREHLFYQFTHHADLSLNQVYSFCKEIFEDESLFLDAAQNILQALYEQSTHPSIKLGELLVVHFGNIQLDDTLTDAVGIFKIERKNKFFKFTQQDEGIGLEIQQGFSMQKLDKAALIINQDEGQGYKVLSIDNNNYDTAYWKKHFLNLAYINNHNLQTAQYLNLCRDFSENVLADELGTEKQAEFLGNTLRYFSENPTLDNLSFKEEVFAENLDFSESFDQYKADYSEVNDLSFWDAFEVSPTVLKEHKRKLKTEIKLDTRIKIILDPSALEEASENLEKGFDERNKMHYYKVFFNHELR